MMLPSSHNGARFFVVLALKAFNRKKERVRGAVLFLILENKLYYVFKKCILQRSRGRGPKNFLEQAPDPLFCCIAVTIEKCEMLLPQTAKHYPPRPYQ